MTYGYAAVYLCDPMHWSGKGCGLFSFFKPEKNRVRQCPGCGLVRPMTETGDFAKIEVVSADEMQRMREADQASGSS